MAYSAKERAAALAALESNRGNVKYTSDRLGMSASTLRRWRDEMTDPDPGPRQKASLEALPAERANLADRFREFVHAALDMMPGKLADANLQQTAMAAAIAVDKAQLLEGHPTNVTEVREDNAAREQLADRIRRLTTSDTTKPTEPN